MSINIEEERVAFEYDHSKRYPGVCLVRWPKVYRNQYVEAAFQGWLAAKEHAVEMARKGCVLQYDGAGDWWIVIPGKMRQGTYASKEEAEQRAVREGLRIDTPKTEFLDVY